MKFIARTRWEYYVANVVGLVAIVVLLVWCMTRVFAHAGIDFSSIFLWIALALFIALIYALIAFFSSMKSVEVTAAGLTITYVFQKHMNVIPFSEIVDMKADISKLDSNVRSRTIRDTFKLILSDGRVFEFERSQLDQYGKLKATCWKRVKKR